MVLPVTGTFNTHKLGQWRIQIFKVELAPGSGTIVNTIQGTTLILSVPYSCIPEKQDCLPAMPSANQWVIHHCGQLCCRRRYQYHREWDLSRYRWAAGIGCPTNGTHYQNTMGGGYWRQYWRCFSTYCNIKSNRWFQCQQYSKGNWYLANRFKDWYSSVAPSASLEAFSLAGSGNTASVPVFFFFFYNGFDTTGLYGRRSWPLPVWL